VWQLRGRYPNRGFPKIFKDETCGEEAKKLYEEARTMLKMIMDEKRVTLNGIVGRGLHSSTSNLNLSRF
jgi:5-methyltetrahydrofolate--homocysteine methyltransferase